MCFEIAVVATMFAVGNIVFGHFEEGTPKWRRIAKLLVTMGLAVVVSRSFGRAWMWALFGLLTLPVLVVHLWWLPRKGINGWTGQPREKYYALRGWKLPRSG